MAGYRVWEIEDEAVVLDGAPLAAGEVEARYPWVTAIAAHHLARSSEARSVVRARLVTNRRRLFVGPDDTLEPGFPRHCPNRHYATYSVYEWSSHAGGQLRSHVTLADITQAYPEVVDALAGDELRELLVQCPGLLLTLAPTDPPLAAGPESADFHQDT